MIDGFDDRDASGRQDLATLATDIRVRLLNVSAAGCDGASGGRLLLWRGMA